MAYPAARPVIPQARHIRHEPRIEQGATKALTETSSEVNKAGEQGVWLRWGY